MSALEPSQVSEAFLAGWAQARPNDDISIFPSSEGALIGNRSSGLLDLYESYWNVLPHSSSASCDVYLGKKKVELPTGAKSSVLSRGIIDLASSMTWREDGNLPLASTEFLGHALKNLIGIQVDEIHLHLPRFSAASDLGIALLSVFAPTPLSFDADVDVASLTVALNCFYTALDGIRVIVTYAEGQELRGVSGMAKAWNDRGVTGDAAQDFERHAGAWIHAMKRVAVGTRHTKNKIVALGDAPSSDLKNFSGVGGGLGFLFDKIGAETWMLSEFVLRGGIYSDLDIAAQISKADAVFYLTSVIGEAIPRGLTLVSELCENYGIALILISESAGLRKGDLPRFGLAGSYDVDSGRQWLEQGVFDPKRVVPAGSVEELTKRVAHTWGW